MARPDPRGLPVGAHAAPPSGASRVASLSHVHACCRHYPGGITGCSYRSLPQRRRPSPKIRRVGFRIALFEACLAFTTRYGLHVRRVTIMTLYTEGFGRFVTSTTAPIATGWSDRCRVGISPTERTRLSRRTDFDGLFNNPTVWKTIPDRFREYVWSDGTTASIGSMKGLFRHLDRLIAAIDNSVRPPR